MKRIVILVALAINSLFGAAEARNRTPTINVVGRPTVTVWAKTVSEQLNRNMNWPNEMGDQALSGFTYVRFHVDEDGKPIGLTVSRKSGSRQLDLAAMRAVAHIRSMGPMPVDWVNERPIEARLFFAQSTDDLYYQQKTASREDSRRPAPMVADAGLPVFVLNAGSRTQVD